MQWSGPPWGTPRMLWDFKPRSDMVGRALWGQTCLAAMPGAGGEGRGRVATSWGRSRPGSPPRFPSRAGDAGRGRGRGGEGRERGRRGERRNLPPLAASLSALGLGTKGGTLMNSLSAPLPRTRGYLPLATLPPRLSPLSGHTKVSERLEDRDKGSVSSKCDQVGKKVSGDGGLVYRSPSRCSRLPRPWEDEGSSRWRRVAKLYLLSPHPCPFSFGP